MLPFQVTCNMHLKIRLPVVLIPNSIDLYKYKFKIREHPEPTLLWVRAFSKIYNPKMAVDVLAELLKTYPDAMLMHGRAG